jgi:hypothetical protein
MDEALAIRIIEGTGHMRGTIYGRRGCGYIREKIDGFNRAAQGAYYLALVDHMDTRLQCPPAVLSSWLPSRFPSMILRVVVRELESWLLADRNNIAKFLNISIAKVPISPETLQDPKSTLVSLAKQSRSRHIRSALVPNPGSTAKIGRLYTSEMIRFTNNQWDFRAARENGPSLHRCLVRLETLTS